MVNALLSQLFLECVAGLNDRKGCIFTNDMKLTRQNMKYFVHIVCNEIQVKVNLEITTYFFLFAFSILSQLFLIWGCINAVCTDLKLSADIQSYLLFEYSINRTHQGNKTHLSVKCSNTFAHMKN